MEDKTINERKLDEIMRSMKCRMNVSYYKYGPARENFASRVDAVETCEMCIDKFRRTGNADYLVDAMNYLAFRVIFPMPGDYYKATDSDESAGTYGTPIMMEEL